MKRFTLCRTVVDVRNSLVNDGGIIVEVVIKLAFVYQLRMFSVYGFHFHSDFEIGLSVDGLVDFSERSLINLSDDFEIFADFL
jgi:hypothetical protein